MDFFEQANQHITKLNDNEKKIFEYVINNVNEVQKMQIRALADKCYVSATTIMRFTKKLGFSGYREFIKALNVSVHMAHTTEVPEILWKKEYSEEYLKNIMESVRVLSAKTIRQFKQALEGGGRIYFFGTGMDREVAHYAYHLFTSLGYQTACPQENYEQNSMIPQLKDEDLLFIFSLSGKDRECIQMIEKARTNSRLKIASLTQSANNLIQSMSDIDFYVFAEQVIYKDADLTARISMIATIELLVYSLISET